MRRSWCAVGLVLLVACGGDAAPDPSAAAQPAARREREAESRGERAPQPRRVDPRNGGLEIVLGEWAVTPEAETIRPGRVTFVVHNRGTMGHGYEMELEGESSGHGSGDLFEAESAVVGPGETTRLTVTLAPGVYEIECLVDGHDDMGMEGILEVRAGAPLVAARGSDREDRISIEGFAFAPEVATVAAGEEVVWTNRDPAGHTVTSVDGEFGSDELGTGDQFSYTSEEPGVYEYRCAIHPEMRGTVRFE